MDLDVEAFWKAVVEQREEDLRSFFHCHGQIIWPNTKEVFSAEEFILINCAYPGHWEKEVKGIFHVENEIVTVVQVRSRDTLQTWHVVSFMKVEKGKILSLVEYWGEDGPVPRWRRELLSAEREKERS